MHTSLLADELNLLQRPCKIRMIGRPRSKWFLQIFFFSLMLSGVAEVFRKINRE